MKSIVNPIHIGKILCVLFLLFNYQSQAQPSIPGIVYPVDTIFMVDNPDGSSEPFYFTGTNNYYLMYKPMIMVEDILDGMLDLNQKVVRMWFFMDGTKVHDGYNLQPAPNQYNEAGFQHLDSVMVELAERGLKCIPVFVNYWSDFGGMNQYAQWAGGNSNDFYSDPTMKQIYKDYVSQWINRINTVSGVPYKEDPTIFSWQLTNEGRSTSATVQDYVAWAEEMSNHIRTLDPNHMISMGDEGLFAYTYENVNTINAQRELEGKPLISNDWPYAGGQGDWIGLLNLPNISFGTVHNYATDNWGYGLEWGKVWTSYHIEVAHSMNKPCIMEEYDKAYSGQWSQQADQERADVMTAYSDIIYNENMAGDCSWMLVGLNYHDPVQNGYTLSTIDEAGNPTPVEQLWLYRVLWPGDGHQYSKYDPYTAPVLTSHGQRMLERNIQEAPQPFLQHTPANNSQAVSIVPTFSWHSSQYASSYELVVSANADLSNPVYTKTNIVGTSYQLPNANRLNYSTNYYFGVKAINYIGEIQSSNAGTAFTTEQAPPPIEPFNLLAPLSANTAAIATVFDWEPAINATTYQLIVSEDQSLVNPVIDVVVAATQYVSTVSLAYSTDYYWTVYAQNAEDTLTANSSGSFQTQLPNPGIDNFETYSNNTQLRNTWVVNPGGDPLTISLDANNKSEGSYGLSYAYNFSSYSGIQRTGMDADWTGYEGISFWLHGDGSGRDLTIQFQESSGEYWESTISLNSGTPEVEFLPFSSFANPSWGGQVNGQLEVSNIDAIAIYIGGNAGSGTIYIDDIRAANQSNPGNLPPVANAGPDQTITDSDDNGFETVTLNGSASNDPDGTIVDYRWYENGSEVGSAVEVTLNVAHGVHTYTLVVTDNLGAVGNDQVVITVEAIDNQPPLASAGPDQTIIDADGDGVEQVTLDGSGSSDPDGIINAYVWRENGQQIASGANPVVNLNLGTHTITLEVTDNDGATAQDQVIIVIEESVTPSENIALNKPASVSSTDGYAGNGSAAVDGNLNTRWASAWTDNEWIAIDLQGNYQINQVRIHWETAYGQSYQIQVSDDGSSWNTVFTEQSGNGGLDEFTINAQGSWIRLLGTSRGTQWGYSIWEMEVLGTALNQSPVASAGSDQFITDMDNNNEEAVTLNGTGSYDPDGFVASYEWWEGVTLLGTGENLVVTLPVGVHDITLMVTDDQGATSSDGVVVTVQSNNNMVHEAESASLSLVSVEQDAAASGAEFVNMTADGSITWNVFAANSGTYQVNFGYRLPFGNKTQHLNVNGAFVQDLVFAGTTNTWLETTVEVTLQSGYNDITISKFWGWMHFDYITVVPASGARVDIHQTSEGLDLVTVYPNPASSEFWVSLDATDAQQSVMQLFDLAGNQVFKKVTYLLEGTNDLRFELPDSISPGVYVYQFDGQTFKLDGQLIVE